STAAGAGSFSCPRSCLRGGAWCSLNPRRSPHCSIRPAESPQDGLATPLRPPTRSERCWDLREPGSCSTRASRAPPRRWLGRPGSPCRRHPTTSPSCATPVSSPANVTVRGCCTCAPLSARRWGERSCDLLLHGDRPVLVIGLQNDRGVGSHIRGEADVVHQ